MTTPIKRHEALQPLGREHHTGLLFSWKIREGIKRNVDLMRMKNYADWFWTSHLQSHFELEEKHVFSILPDDNEKKQQALREHQLIKSLFENNTPSTDSFSILEKQLEQHIRFEERDLFNEIQLAATDEQLQAIAAHHEDVKQDDWADEFWKG